eukprot:TRINITY_DN43986_c0_g1_i1.p1 TRINITY_DN43986_c0_g1~~TRINITY_DN43986_c0_g1_i1.p1  ORF type:complete len:336 (-),score=29.07 TRINITY_DN43986_c0_g1_i1:55-1062(-)
MDNHEAISDYMDCTPKPWWQLAMYRGAATTSMLACVGFGIFVWKNRLLQTILVKQVIFLSLADFLVLCWEQLVCASVIHYNTCVHFDGNVNVLFPLLRTLQLSSVLWIAMVALGVAATVRGKPFRLPCCMHWVWPCAALLCLPHWIEGLQPRLRSFPPRQLPETVFMLEVLGLLVVVLGAYADALFRILRLSTFAVLRRSLHRILHYVVIFLLLYVPYIVIQVLTAYQDRCRWNHEGLLGYFVIYMMYYLVGAANVCAYGWNHWDGGWRSECRLQRSSTRNGRSAYVVRILDAAETAISEGEELQDLPCLAEEQAAAAFQQNYGPTWRRQRQPSS